MLYPAAPAVPVDEPHWLGKVQRVGVISAPALKTAPGAAGNPD